MPVLARCGPVLVAPMDWGLGHATRCIPVIRQLKKYNCRVLVAATGLQAGLLKAECEDIELLSMPEYGIRYTANPVTLALQFPAMVTRVFAVAAREQRWLRQVVATRGIRAVVSDQRFGLFSAQIPSIFITHQLRVKLPPGCGLLERWVAWALYRAAARFGQVWIPDFFGPDSLSGELSRPCRSLDRMRHIGPLSRFQQGKGPTEPWDLLVMLSGPEPQRTLFQNRVLDQLTRFEGRVLVVCGVPGTTVPRSPRANVTIVDHLSTDRLEASLRGARNIVCRGGYSSIMDLVTLGKRALLVPTPGQTEQEYLCRTLAKRGLFHTCGQKDLSLAHALHTGMATADGLPAARPPQTAFEEAVQELCGQCA